jgi:nucleoside-diphosphate-sugar epimerase
MARVLVTGGSGFIGTNLVAHFAAAGHQVLSVDVVPPMNKEHKNYWQAVDVLDRAQLARAIATHQPEYVFHFAARTDLGGRTVDDYQANTVGVANLVNALRDTSAPALVVFASSMLVCRLGYVPSHDTDYCATTAYGHSKVLGEQTVRHEAANAFPWVIVRPTSIWGPWFRAPYRDFFTAVQRGHYFHPRAHRIRRSYGFVLNSVAQLAALAASHGAGLIGSTVYLADYEPIELKAWAETIRRAFEAPKIREVSVAWLRVAAHAGDLMQRFGWRTPPLTSFRLSNLLTDMVHDMRPLRTVCPTLPYTMSQGVEITRKWMQTVEGGS